MKQVSIKKFNEHSSVQTTDVVIAESVYYLYVNNEKIFAFTCLDENIKEMVYGYLLASQIAKNISDILEYKADGNTVFVEIEATDNKLIRSEGRTCSARIIYKLFERFIDGSKLHKKTGAVHSMAISNNNEVIIQIDDISRHAALDKIIGFCFLNNIELDDKILLSTCRITESIAHKVSATQIQAIFSKSAVTEQAIQICNEHQILLIGFIKKDSFNVYTFQERIV